MILHSLHEGRHILDRPHRHYRCSHALAVLFIWGPKGDSFCHLWVAQQRTIHLHGKYKVSVWDLPVSARLLWPAHSTSTALAHELEVHLCMDLWPAALGSCDSRHAGFLRHCAHSCGRPAV